MKVFAIGTNKTGTSSLFLALRILGYETCPIEPMFEEDSKYLDDFQNGKYEKLFELVEKYDAFKDRPWNQSDFYKVLAEKYPDAKFILTVRDSKNWIESYKRWSDRISLRNKWFYKTISQTCYGVDDFLANEKTVLTKYVTRNMEVRMHFMGTKRLLVIDFEREQQPWERLCSFLDRPQPRLEFPHLNRTK